MIQQRLNSARIPVSLVFLILIARLWQLQIVQGSEYADRAERNRVRTIRLVAPRGTIFDRTRVPLVENRPSFDILLYRESMTDQAATAAFLERKLAVSPEDFAARLRRGKSRALYQPLVMKEDAGIEDISVIEAHRRDHPEIQVGPEQCRLYRHGKLAAHALGYIGEISEQELAEDVFPGTAAGSQVGKGGIERVYNQLLIGEDGTRQVLVDSLGREVGLLDEQEPSVGGELQLTLDVDLQSAADSLLQDKVGAIVVMDPRNGEILAMASSPSFEPNSFSTHISEEEWNQLLSNPDKPLQNRAIQNSYSPGSIFKLVMADAGLEEGMLDDRTSVICKGWVVHYGRVYHCASKSGHGSVNLESAIARSCNIFFYDLGRRLGISKIALHARALGLGQLSGIDLPGEKSGLMPSAEWKAGQGATWYPGETISVAIGQGAVSTTPLQIVRAVSALATGGRLTTPHLLLRSERNPDMALNWPVRQLPIGGDNTRRIRQGMWASVNDGGTGHNAAIPGLDICGKTGTAQVVSNEYRKEFGQDSSVEDHSWFAGFAEKDNPEIAVVVFVEHGGGGGIAAAPLAKEIFRVYFAKKNASKLITEIRSSTVDSP